MADHLNWLLRNLTDSVAGIRGAVLLAGDGVKRAWHGIPDDESDRVAAAASGLLSLGRQLGGNDIIRMVMIEFSSTLALVTSPSENSVLIVLADSSVDVRDVNYAMTDLSARLGNHMATQARTPAGGTTAP